MLWRTNSPISYSLTIIQDNSPKTFVSNKCDCFTPGFILKLSINPMYLASLNTLAICFRILFFAAYSLCG